MDLSLDKTSVGRGDSVTISSVEGCIADDVAGEVHVTFKAPDGIVEELMPDVAADGSWTTGWLVLEGEPSGTYSVLTNCVYDDDTSRSYENASFTVFEYPATAEGLPMNISPEAPAVADPGSSVGVSSGAPCPPFGVDRVVAWAAFPLTADGDIGEAIDYGLGSLGADGNWNASFSAPQNEGAYVVAAGCFRVGYEWAGEDIEVVDVPTAWYEPELLLVGPHPTVPDGPLPEVDEIPVADAPAAAHAVSGRPSTTG